MNALNRNMSRPAEERASTTMREAINLSNNRVMNIARHLLTLLVALGVIGAFGPAAAAGASTPSDSLHVGDAADGTFKRFDAATGAYLGKFITQGAQLQGPRGILPVSNGNFLVSNQNAGTPIAGEIDQFASNGKALGALVPHTAANAPFAPHGIILGPRPGTTSPDTSTLYVADAGRDSPPLGDCVGTPQTPCGAVKLYDITTGTFLQNLDFSSVTKDLSDGDFRPRGVVFGPDGLLYVSVFRETDLSDGVVLSYSTLTGQVNVVARQTIAGDLCRQHLHRPEGLTFGPDGRLYVTSFRLNSGDIDRILVFGSTGACSASDEIALDEPGQPRAFAQALVFRPGGTLFIPISGQVDGPGTPIGPQTGAVRRYSVTDNKFLTSLVVPRVDGGPVGAGWYLTFARTNPHTLAYGP